jgi:hypothetical protein
VKRVLFLIVLLLAAIASGLLWKKNHSRVARVSEEKTSEESTSRITHDESGRVVIKMDDETQGNLGLLVAKPAAAHLSPELKGYGKVLDSAALTALLTELYTAEAALINSNTQLDRLKELSRPLQMAEAMALRDWLAVQSIKDRLVLSWGKGVAEQTNLRSFIESLTTQNAVLVRLDLPVGESLPSTLRGARISTLSGRSAAAEFLGTTFNVDPQTLSRGATFLIKPNLLDLRSGEAVTGYLELPGDPLTGVLVPSEAVVRPEGRAWVYIMTSGGDSFTRTEISLDHPAEAGWVVTKGVSTNDYVVVTGAQTLLSEELKASLKPD